MLCACMKKKLTWCLILEMLSDCCLRSSKAAGVAAASLQRHLRESPIPFQSMTRQLRYLD